jgi:MFS family permease
LALLPIVASRRLGLGASGYGLLLGALGVGAVAGALVLPRVRGRLSNNQLLFAAGIVVGVVLLVVGLVRGPVVVTLALVPAGVAWVTVLSSINAAMQLWLPNWVRARGLSIYQIVFAGGQGFGALAWGALAEATSVVTAHVAAGLLMILGAVTVRWLPLRETAGMNRESVAYWPEPHLEIEAEPDAGPVLVTLRYRVPAEHADAFVAAMAGVRRSRMRTGAMRWGLFREGESAGHFVEVYQVPSWDEHLRQHGGRLTGRDEEIERQALDLADGPPEVAHLLPAGDPA